MFNEVTAACIKTIAWAQTQLENQLDPAPVATHWLDTAFALLLGRPRLFADGWGDAEALNDFLRYIKAPGEPDTIEPSLRRISDKPGQDTLLGAFESKAPFLPLEARTACFQLVLPAGQPSAPVCIILASSGDEGYVTRRFTNLPLVKKGIGILMLESPFYGMRRPPGQEGANIRTVAEQYALCRAVVQESVALLAWLRRRGHQSAGISGYSMGGSMAGLAAVCTPFPIAVVLGATGLNGAAVVTRNLLSRQVHWNRLGDPIAAREKLAEQCERASLDRLPLPRDPSSAVLVGYTQDGYVDRSSISSLHKHWRTSTLRWIKAGHISGIAVHASSLRQATIDAFARRSAQQGSVR